jgi:hypothetical protein
MGRPRQCYSDAGIAERRVGYQAGKLSERVMRGLWCVSGVPAAMAGNAVVFEAVVVIARPQVSISRSMAPIWLQWLT